MYAGLENVNLSKFNVPIADFVNQLVDPALLAIPNDSVFISYREPERLRLMSASSLQEMVKQMEESRKFVEKAPQDKSMISMVINSSDMDKSYEKVLKDILRFLVEKGMDRAEIRMISNVLNFGAIQAINVAKTNEQLSIGIINDIKNMLGEDKAHLFDNYLTILKSSESSSDFKLLPQYLEELITQQQVELETQRKKLRDKNGDNLKLQEVICPLTRQIIDVERSQATQANAAQFIMLIVALARLAKVKHNELEEFIISQDSDYVNKCFGVLQQYVQNLKQTIFTEEQQKLLKQLGIDIVIQQWQAQESHAHSGPGLAENKVTNDASEAPQHLADKSYRFFNNIQPQRDGERALICNTPFGAREQNT